MWYNPSWSSGRARSYAAIAMGRNCCACSESPPETAVMTRLKSRSAASRGDIELRSGGAPAPPAGAPTGGVAGAAFGPG